MIRPGMGAVNLNTPIFRNFLPMTSGFCR
jgi:hypothetical protein